MDFASDDLALPNLKRHKVVFVTGMWQRHDVFKMFAEGIRHLQITFAHRLDIHCCVVGSEKLVSKQLALSYPNFHYTDYSNKFLSAKMNDAVKLAKTLDPDYYLMLGSDDIIGVSLMKRYLQLMDEDCEYVYLLDCYFFDTVSKRGLYWGGYQTHRNKGFAAGIGKLLSRRLMEKIGWLCFPNGYDRVLDTGFEARVSAAKPEKVSIRLKAENLFALDIKSSTNMTPFAMWDNTTLIDGKKMLDDNLPKHLVEMIYGKLG